MSSGDSGDYIIYNTLEVATGGDCGGDYVFDHPSLPRLKFSNVFVRREPSAPRTWARGSVPWRETTSALCWHPTTKGMARRRNRKTNQNQEPLRTRTDATLKRKQAKQHTAQRLLSKAKLTPSRMKLALVLLDMMVLKGRSSRRAVLE